MSDLIEDGAQLFQRENPKRVGGDGDDAFGTLFRRETGSVLERLVGKRSEMEPVLVRVGKPSAARHSQHRVVALHADAEEFDRLGTQVTSTSVREIASYRV